MIGIPGTELYSHEQRETLAQGKNFVEGRDVPTFSSIFGKLNPDLGCVHGL